MATLCYGGGVKTVEQVQEIISLGVEKVAMSSAAISTPDLISDAAARVGRRQPVCVQGEVSGGVDQLFQQG